MYTGLHVRYPLFLSDFNETLIFSTDFRKNAQISNFMKIRYVGAQVVPFGRTDVLTNRHDDDNSRFSHKCEKRLKLLYHFSACCNHTYLHSFIRMWLYCWIKKLLHFFFIKDFSLHVLNFISNKLLPPEANISRNCIMLIHTL